MAELKIDKYVFLGDAVGYMPHGAEVLELLNSINADCLMGNHEAMLCGFLDYSNERDKVYQLKKALPKIPEHTLKNIKTWLPFKVLTFDNINVLFAHGSPWNPLLGYVHPDSTERSYNNSQYDFIFLGHSHRPFISKNTRTTVVNVGSVGLPRDFGNMPSFVIWDTITGEVEIIRIEIDNRELILDLEKNNTHEEVLMCMNRA